MTEHGLATHVYGPVPSRRLGYSLGIDIVSHKICSFDCLYCQLGKTTDLTLERKVYADPDKVIAQVMDVVNQGARIDCLTLSGSGEPTLNSRIGYVIRELKKRTSLPVAVITNGSLLFMREVRADIADADVVLPTLCAVREETMRLINRHHAGLSARTIVDGLIEFRRHYQGKIWLEVMIVKGINDTAEEIAELKKAVNAIKPDKVQLNTVARPPSERSARPVGIPELERICSLLGSSCEVIAEFKEQDGKSAFMELPAAILEMTRRRPVTAEDISRSLGRDLAEVQAGIEELLKEKKIKKTRHGGAFYYGPAGH